MAWLSILFPLGALTAVAINNVLVDLEWSKSEPAEQTPAALLKIACEQLSAYFDGRSEKFNLPVAPSRTDFRRRVWTIMPDISYGQAHACG